MESQLFRKILSFINVWRRQMVLSKKEWKNKSARKKGFDAYCRMSLLCIAFIGATLAAVSRQASAEDTVTLAIAGPMVGNSFSIGIQYNAGVTAAVQTLPDGLLLGKKLNIKTYDDKCNTAIAEKVAQDLVLENPAVVIGHSCSMATLVAAPIYARHKLLQITPASTNPQITEIGIGTIFRMIGRDDVQGKLAAERIATHYAGKKVGIFYFTGGYSRGLTQTAIDALEKQGIKPVHASLGIVSAASYGENIQDLIDAGVEVLYLVGGGLDSGVFMRQVRQMDAPFDVISSDTLVSKVFIETAGAAGEGVPFTFPPEAAELSTAKPAVAAIKKLGHEPAGYTLFAYAATQTWIEGVRRANSFDAELVAAAIRQAPIETVLGEVSFDAKGDIHTAYPAFSWYVWKRGKRVSAD
jgi:branched-chain amino acid transport system substrate-binding protein